VLPQHHSAVRAEIERCEGTEVDTASTVKDTVVGSEARFEDRGQHSLAD